MNFIDLLQILIITFLFGVPYYKINKKRKQKI